MSESAALSKRQLADRLSAAWATLNGVVGICIYGSVARGDADQNSDIDMIVLSSDSELTSQDLIDKTPVSSHREDISLRVYTPADLTDHLKRSPIFAAHLRSEGVIVYDRGSELSSIINQDYPISVPDELNWQRKNLELYEHSERFGQALLFPLARLYSIGRAVVFSRLFEQGILEFDAPRAFAKLRHMRPEWGKPIDEIGSLRPFFQSVRRDYAGTAWPFDPSGVDARKRFDSAKDALRELLTASGEE